MYDAIVVGARCAGSPTAMLLARKGYRVLLLDRSTFPSDIMSTHYIHPPGVARLERWGLLDRLRASNCPPISSVTLHFGELVFSPPPFESRGLPETYCPRRTVLDKILLDALGEKTAVVFGHDWGAPMAWSCALLYPDRFPAVAALSVPFMPRSPMPPIQLLKQMFPNNFFYMLYFQQPGPAEAELEADVRKFMRLMLYGASGDAPQGALLSQKPKDAKLLEGMPEPKQLPSWLTEADLDYYTHEFERTGFRGGLN